MHPPSRHLAAAAILLSAITLGVSYGLPTVSFDAMASPEEIYSIWGGIVSLWEDGNWVLAPVVFIFSMIFPVTKLVALGLLVSGRVNSAKHKRLLEWVHLLGKWSMLDVFIVGVFVAAVQLDLTVKGQPTGLHLARSTSHWGIHVFTLAIVMSMASAWLVERAFGVTQSYEAGPYLRSWGGRALATGRALALVAVLALPLLEVSRKIEFRFLKVDSSNEVHLWHTTARLAREGEFLLAVALGLFVIGFPVLRALCSLRLRWLGGRPSVALRLARGLDSWAMVDVFGLGLLIVQVKLAELTTTQLMAGFWMTLVAAVLALLESWHLRHVAAAALRQKR